MKVITLSKAEQTRLFAVAAALFVVWGLALWLYNALLPKFAALFAFHAVHIAFTQASFHFAYVLVTVPAVLFHRKFGYKLGLLSGLSIFGIGAFLLYLALVQHSLVSFLGAVVMIGSCGAWLDTSLNPLAAIAGDADTVIRRMNMAHAFNGLGMFVAFSTAVSLLGSDYQLSTGATAQLSARPYVLVGLGAILLAFLLEQITLPAIATRGVAKHHEFRAELGAVASDKAFGFAALALCAFCVVLTFLWSANYRYRMAELPALEVPFFQRVWFWLVIGRIVGCFLMRRIDPMRLLAWCSVLCIAGTAATAATGGMAGWVCLLFCSLLMSIMYPTIFGSAISRHWSRIATTSGVLVMAAGLGNGLSALAATTMLGTLGINPRLVIFMALPFEAVVLAYALRSYMARSMAPAAA